jgi:hypothetical protein
MTSAFNFAAPSYSIPALPPTALADPRVLASDCVRNAIGVVTENAANGVPISGLTQSYPVTVNDRPPSQEPGLPRRPSGLLGATQSVSGGTSELSVRISGVPRGCTRAGFRASVRIEAKSSLRWVHVRVNGALVLRTRRRRFGVPVGTARLHRGRNRISVIVRDRAGHQAVAIARFERC